MNDELCFEPMDLGTLLDRTFKIYFRNIKLLLGIVGVSYLPLLVFGIFFAIFFNFFDESITASEDIVGPVIILFAGAFGFIILYWLSMTFAAAATCFAVSKRYLGEPVGVMESFRHVSTRLGPLLVAQLIVGLIVGVGALLCLLPGLFLLVAYAIVIPVMTLENVSSEDGRTRAWDLLKNYRWMTVGILLLLGFISAGLSMGVSMFFQVGGLVLQGSENSEMLMVIMMILSQLGSMAASILVMPLNGIATTLLYYNARIREEGFDLEMLAENILGSDERGGESPYNADAY